MNTRESSGASCDERNGSSFGYSSSGVSLPLISLEPIWGSPSQYTDWKSPSEIQGCEDDWKHTSDEKIGRPWERFKKKIANGSTSSIKTTVNSEVHDNSTCTWRVLSKVQFLVLLKSGWWETIALENFLIILIAMITIMITIKVKIVMIIIIIMII